MDRPCLPDLERIKARIHEGVALMERPEVVELLGGLGDERRLLRIKVGGREVYPRFQFDGERRRVIPAVAELTAMAPATWTDLRILHWLTRPHVDMGGPPAEHLDVRGAQVLAAFAREIVVPDHG